MPQAHSEKEQRQRIIEAIQTVETYADQVHGSEGGEKREAAEGVIEALYALHGLTDDDDLQDAMNDLERLLVGSPDESRIDAVVNKAVEAADSQHPQR